MGNTIDRSALGKETNEGPSAPARRPWHAPQFMLTDVASTDLQGNAATDASPVSQLS